MRKRQSRRAGLEKDLSQAGAKAVETMSDLAEQAWTLAREVGHVASPAMQRSAESLARALERAADSKLAKAGEQQATEVALVARERLADASEKFADVVRPRARKQTHRLRNTAIGLAAIGGAVALFQSPLRSKLTERLFGPPPEDEPESITLPGAAAEPVDGPPPLPPDERGNGVPSTTAAGVDAGKG